MALSPPLSSLHVRASAPTWENSQQMRRQYREEQARLNFKRWSSLHSNFTEKENLQLFFRMNRIVIAVSSAMRQHSGLNSTLVFSKSYSAVRFREMLTNAIVSQLKGLKVHIEVSYLVCGKLRCYKFNPFSERLRTYHQGKVKTV